jgi:hypothetical protein
MKIKNLLTSFLVIGSLLFGAIDPAYATTALASAGVQCGTATIASSATTGTASISAVGSGAFLLYNGQTTTNTGTAPNASLARVALSGTTITATRNTAAANTISVNFCVVDGDTTNLIKSVQTGTINFGTTTTGTASISAVTTANTAVHYLGLTSSSASAISPITSFTALSLTSTTQVTATLGSAPGTNTITVGYEVIEFQPGALQSLQAVADAASPAATTRTKTITSVTQGNTFIIWAGQLTTGGASYTSGDQYAQLTAATTVTIGTNTAPSVSIQDNFYVVELVSGLVETSAQRGNISIAASTSGTATLSPTYTLADAMLTYVGNQTNGTTADTRNSKLATTSSTVTATTNGSATTKTGWEVIGLNPAVTATPFAGSNLWISLDGL